MPETLRIVTYNIHSGIGMDSVFSIERIIRVLQEINPDIVAIQEVATSRNICGDTDPVAALRNAFGPYVSAAASLVGSQSSHYGNLILSKYPFLRTSMLDISSHNREPRNALDVDVKIGKSVLRIITAHLGLRRKERQKQIERLSTLLKNDRGKPVVFMGDVNEWRKKSPALKAIENHLYAPNAPLNFISRIPLFALDRIWGRPKDIFLGKIKAHRSPLARQASDHLPVYTDIKL